MPSANLEASECASCGGSGIEGVLSVHRDKRAPDTIRWAEGGQVESFPLCSRCYSTIRRTLQLSMGPNETRPFGAPQSSRPGGLDPAHCNYCGGGFSDERFDLELTPVRYEWRGHDRRIVGPAFMTRLCLGCLTWSHTVTLGQLPGAPRPQRRWEGVASYLNESSRGIVFSVGLSSHDEGILALAFDGTQVQYLPLMPGAVGRFAGTPGAILFLGGHNRADINEMLTFLPPEALARTAVAVPFTGLRELFVALRAGVGDFLAEPISGHQVEGAFRRITEAGGRTGPRHPSGLQLMRKDAIAPGGGYHTVVIGAADLRQRLRVAWLLRRFTRGYDEVGCGIDGNIILRIACADAALMAVISRLETLLGQHWRPVQIPRLVERQAA